MKDLYQLDFRIHEAEGGGEIVIQEPGRGWSIPKRCTRDELASYIGAIVACRIDEERLRYASHIGALLPPIPKSKGRP